LAGAYNGLFFEESNIRHEHSGFLSVKVADLGGFTAKMILGGKRLSFSGKFALDGKATNSIPRAGSNLVTIMLCLDLVSSTDQIIGLVGDGARQAAVLADRARFDPHTNA